MSTTLEQIRTALGPYIAETNTAPGFPENLLEMLEEADDDAKEVAESLEGMLAVYAANRVSLDSLKQEIRALLTPAEKAFAVGAFFPPYMTLSPMGAVGWTQFVYRSDREEPPSLPPPAPPGSNMAALSSPIGTSTYNDVRVSLH